MKRPRMSLRSSGYACCQILSVVPDKRASASADPGPMTTGGNDHEGWTLQRICLWIRSFAGTTAAPPSSLRANGSRECAPDDRLREAIF